MPHPVDAVFFDLDGTLADTAIDLAAALNKLLNECHRPPLSLERVRQIASNGSVALIKTGFNIERTHPNFKTYQQRFLQYYRGCLTDHPDFMPGMFDVLKQLVASNIPWGIVTNKPAWLTDPLVAAIAFPNAPTCIVSGDTSAKSKPYPDSLLHACQLLRVEPERCVYIGDAKRDIQAGKAAGMYTIAALFGYLSSEDSPKHWGADSTVNTAQDLLSHPCLTG